MAEEYGELDKRITLHARKYIVSVVDGGGVATTGGLAISKMRIK
jgi:hypothetical protein